MELRYRAFLSYSHSDTPTVAWLHRVLEAYRVPTKLVGRATPYGPVPRRLRPIFRDREELSASSDLSTAITEALHESAFLIIVCSPAAATSRWVNEEVLAFKRRHGEGRVLPIIVSGEPNAGVNGATSAQECFPVGVRWRMGPDGELSDTPAEVVAADLRPNGDGRRLAALKLTAGLTGLRLDELVQRETQRRVQRLMYVAAGASAGMFLTGGLAIYANERRVDAIEQRRRAEEQRGIAERESATAKAASDYLIGTFALANPATDNPNTITALSILDLGAERAEQELNHQPVVQARLIDTLGQAYLALGRFDKTRALVERSEGALERAGADGAGATLTLAWAYLKLGMTEKALRAVRKAEASLGGNLLAFKNERARAATTEGAIHSAASETAAGVAAFDRALSLYRRPPAAEDAKVAPVLINRGLLLSDNGQFKEAEASLQEALHLYQRSIGPRHVKTGQTWFALAQNAFLAGDLERAKMQIATALSIERQMLEPDNPTIADSLSLQGQIFQAANRPLEGERSLREAISIYRKAYGGPHYLIGIAEVYLALIQSSKGETGRALRMLDDAKYNYDRSYGRLHANHGDLLVHRATILAKAGRRAEARSDCASGLDILNRTLGEKAAYTVSMATVCNKL